MKTNAKIYNFITKIMAIVLMSAMLTNAMPTHAGIYHWDEEEDDDEDKVVEDYDESTTMAYDDVIKKFNCGYANKVDQHMNLKNGFSAIVHNGNIIRYIPIANKYDGDDSNWVHDTAHAAYIDLGQYTHSVRVTRYGQHRGMADISRTTVGKIVTFCEFSDYNKNTDEFESIIYEDWICVWHVNDDKAINFNEDPDFAYEFIEKYNLNSEDICYATSCVSDRDKAKEGWRICSVFVRIPESRRYNIKATVTRTTALDVDINDRKATWYPDNTYKK